MPGSSAQAPASFINKPARGWLHPDHLFARDGINYAVRYVVVVGPIVVLNSAATVGTLVVWR